jgi:hypothetical protein
MSGWTVMSAVPAIRPRNDVFGNYFVVTFKLKYSPPRFGSFTEMPRLEWKETITMLEKRKGTWWQIDVDQYQRDPDSRTFTSWVNRYVWAHGQVTGQRYGADAPVKLFDEKGGRLPATTFARTQDSKTAADEVRSYLKSRGGIMEITVEDKPGINKPTGGDTTFHKHRILTFDCGVGSGGPRVKAYQTLIVDGAVPEAQWRRECEVSSFSSPFSTAGLTKGPPPADVSIVKPFTGGAHQGTYL